MERVGIERVGDILLELCRKARKEVVLAAPFIKEPTLKRLLDDVQESVIVRCVTRWRPAEVAAGVSDLAVLPLVEGRRDGSLFLRQDLHAKYFRADSSCLVGSPNLTGTALGWSPAPNLELLVRVDGRDKAMVEFEKHLFEGVIVADSSIAKEVARAAALLVPDSSLLVGSLEVSSLAEEGDTPQTSGPWLPKLRHPEDLYVAYCGELEDLTAVSAAAAKEDLTVLQPPPKLPKATFQAVIGSTLLQMPIVRQIDEFVTQPRRFGAVRALLADRMGIASSDVEASRAWQVLMRWLLYFLPHRFERTAPHYSEIFQRTVESLAEASLREP